LIAVGRTTTLTATDLHVAQPDVQELLPITVATLAFDFAIRQLLHSITLCFRSIVVDVHFVVTSRLMFGCVFFGHLPHFWQRETNPDPFLFVVYPASGIEQ
jgi:hypothetical protein